MVEEVIRTFDAHPWVPSLIGLWAIWCVLILILRKMPKVNK